MAYPGFGAGYSPLEDLLTDQQSPLDRLSQLTSEQQQIDNANELLRLKQQGTTFAGGMESNDLNLDAADAFQTMLQARANGDVESEQYANQILQNIQAKQQALGTNRVSLEDAYDTGAYADFLAPVVGQGVKQMLPQVAAGALLSPLRMGALTTGALTTPLGYSGNYAETAGGMMGDEAAMRLAMENPERALKSLSDTATINAAIDIVPGLIGARGVRGATGAVTRGTRPSVAGSLLAPVGEGLQEIGQDSINNAGINAFKGEGFVSDDLEAAYNRGGVRGAYEKMRDDGDLWDLGEAFIGGAASAGAIQAPIHMANSTLADARQAVGDRAQQVAQATRAAADSKAANLAKKTASAFANAVKVGGREAFEKMTPDVKFDYDSTIDLLDRVAAAESGSDILSIQEIQDATKFLRSPHAKGIASVAKEAPGALWNLNKVVLKSAVDQAFRMFPDIDIDYDSVTHALQAMSQAEDLTDLVQKFRKVDGQTGRSNTMEAFDNYRMKFGDNIPNLDQFADTDAKKEMIGMNYKLASALLSEAIVDGGVTESGPQTKESQILSDIVSGARPLTDVKTIQDLQSISRSAAAKRVNSMVDDALDMMREAVSQTGSTVEDIFNGAVDSAAYAVNTYGKNKKNVQTTGKKMPPAQAATLVREIISRIPQTSTNKVERDQLHFDLVRALSQNGEAALSDDNLRQRAIALAPTPESKQAVASRMKTSGGAEFAPVSRMSGRMDSEAKARFVRSLAPLMNQTGRQALQQEPDTVVSALLDLADAHGALVKGAPASNMKQIFDALFEKNQRTAALQQLKITGTARAKNTEESGNIEDELSTASIEDEIEETQMGGKIREAFAARDEDDSDSASDASGGLDQEDLTFAEKASVATIIDAFGKAPSDKVEELVETEGGAAIRFASPNKTNPILAIIPNSQLLDVNFKKELHQKLKGRKTKLMPGKDFFESLDGGKAPFTTHEQKLKPSGGYTYTPVTRHISLSNSGAFLIQRALEDTKRAILNDRYFSGGVESRKALVALTSVLPEEMAGEPVSQEQMARFDGIGYEEWMKKLTDAINKKKLAAEDEDLFEGGVTPRDVANKLHRTILNNIRDIGEYQRQNNSEQDKETYAQKKMRDIKIAVNEVAVFGGMGKNNVGDKLIRAVVMRLLSTASSAQESDAAKKRLSDAMSRLNTFAAARQKILDGDDSWMDMFSVSVEDKGQTDRLATDPNFSQYIASEQRAEMQPASDAELSSYAGFDPNKGKVYGYTGGYKVLVNLKGSEEPVELNSRSIIRAHKVHTNTTNVSNKALESDPNFSPLNKFSDALARIMARSDFESMELVPDFGVGYYESKIKNADPNSGLIEDYEQKLAEATAAENEWRSKNGSESITIEKGKKPAALPQNAILLPASFGKPEPLLTNPNYNKNTQSLGRKLTDFEKEQRAASDDKKRVERRLSKNMNLDELRSAPKPEGAEKLDAKFDTKFNLAKKIDPDLSEAEYRSTFARDQIGVLARNPDLSDKQREELTQYLNSWVSQTPLDTMDKRSRLSKQFGKKAESVSTFKTEFRNRLVKYNAEAKEKGVRKATMSQLLLGVYDRERKRFELITGELAEDEIGNESTQQRKDRLDAMRMDMTRDEKADVDAAYNRWAAFKELLTDSLAAIYPVTNFEDIERSDSSREGEQSEFYGDAERIEHRYRIIDELKEYREDLLESGAPENSFPVRGVDKEIKASEKYIADREGYETDVLRKFRNATGYEGEHRTLFRSGAKSTQLFDKSDVVGRNKRKAEQKKQRIIERNKEIAAERDQQRTELDTEIKKLRDSLDEKTIGTSTTVKKLLGMGVQDVGIGENVDLMDATSSRAKLVKTLRDLSGLIGEQFSEPLRYGSAEEHHDDFIDKVNDMPFAQVQKELRRKSSYLDRAARYMNEQQRVFVEEEIRALKRRQRSLGERPTKKQMPDVTIDGKTIPYTRYAARVEAVIETLTNSLIHMDEKAQKAAFELGKDKAIREKMREMTRARRNEFVRKYKTEAAMSDLGFGEAKTTKQILAQLRKEFPEFDGLSGITKARNAEVYKDSLKKVSDSVKFGKQAENIKLPDVAEATSKLVDDMLSQFKQNSGRGGVGTKVKKNQQATNKRLSAEFRKNAQQIADEYLGKGSVKVETNKLAEQLDGAAGQMFEDLDGDHIVRVAKDALNPDSVLRHELFHALWAKLNVHDPRIRELKAKIEKMANRLSVKQQLLTELIKYDEANGVPKEEAAKKFQDALNDPEETAAYMFQLYTEGNEVVRKLLPARSPERSFLDKMVDFVLNLVGAVRESEQVKGIFDSFNSGAFSDPETIDMMFKMSAGNTLSEKVRNAAGPVAVWYDVVTSESLQRMRDMNVPAITRLADSIRADTQSGAVENGTDFTLVRHRMTGQLRGTYDKMTENMSNEDKLDIITRMQTGEPQKDEAAAGVAAMLEHAQNVNGSTMFSFDTHALSKKRDTFLEKVREVTGSKNDRIGLTFYDYLMSHGGYVGQNESDIYMGYASFVPDDIKLLTSGKNIKHFADFLHKDLDHAADGAIVRAAHRATIDRIFPPRRDKDGKLIEDGIDVVLSEAKTQGASKEEIASARQMALTAMGVGHQNRLSANAIDMMGWAKLAMNTAILPLSLASQMIDPLALAARSGKFSDIFRAYGTGLTHLFNQIRGDKSLTKDFDMARTLGLIQNEVATQAMGFYSLNSSASVRKISDTFFKLNGMQGWNDAMRIASFRSGKDYIREKYLAGDREALGEMGLQNAVIPFDDNGDILIDTKTPVGKGLAAALHAYVESSVARADAAYQPGWMSDPRFALLSHLKQFTYAFSNTVLARASHQLSEKGKVGPMAYLMAAAPVMLAVDMAKWASLGYDPTQGWGASQYIHYGMARAGLFGKSSAFIAPNFEGGLLSLDTPPFVDAVNAAMGLDIDKLLDTTLVGHKFVG